MKIAQWYLVFVLLFVFAGLSVADAHAEDVTGIAPGREDHTAAEEAAGQIVWQKLQTKETNCAQLAENDFAALGEYFMGLMLAPSGTEGSRTGMGTSHGLMNQMITQMHGEEGEEAMHVALGKRLSGCDPNAAFAPGAFGSMPMMNMGFGMWGSGNGMMGYGPGRFGNFGGGWNFGLGGTLFMILWWTILIAGVITIVKWLAALFKGKNSDH